MEVSLDRMDADHPFPMMTVGVGTQTQEAVITETFKPRY